MSARPHHIGSPGGKAVAEYMQQYFASLGYDSKIETLYTLFSTPKERLLEMNGPVKFKATLAEPPLKEDGTSGQTKEQLPIYNCWSADGDVTGELVFVNYGLPEDYETLRQLGIDVKGKIVIAKYGRSWRGIKPKVAQEHGAIGCLIYSDPQQDGYGAADVYPKGGARPDTGVPTDGGPALLVGTLWWALGQRGWGELMRYIPYPVIGGFLADRYLGTRKAIAFGALLLGALAVFDRIADQPALYPEVWDDVREAPVSKYPYCVYYRVEPGRLVAGNARDRAGNWSDARKVRSP